MQKRNSQEISVKNIFLPSLKVFTLLAMTFLVLYAMGITLGWFSNNNTAKGSSPSATLQNYNHPTVTMWTYTTDKEASTAGWVKYPLQEAEIGTAITTFPQTGLKAANFTLEKLQFGTIDNLVKIKEDNIVYLRFKVTPEVAGDPFTLWATTQKKEYEEGQVYPFSIYDPDGTAVSPTTEADMYEEVRVIVEGTKDSSGTVLTEATPLFSYYFAQSSTCYDVSDFADTSKLTFTEPEKKGEFSYTPTSTDPYYIYLKIQPILSTFAKIAEPLTKHGHMPCLLLYDFTIFYSVKEVATED